MIFDTTKLIDIIALLKRTYNSVQSEDRIFDQNEWDKNVTGDPPALDGCHRTDYSPKDYKFLYHDEYRSALEGIMPWNQCTTPACTLGHAYISDALDNCRELDSQDYGYFRKNFEYLVGPGMNAYISEMATVRSANYEYKRGKVQNCKRILIPTCREMGRSGASTRLKKLIEMYSNRLVALESEVDDNGLKEKAAQMRVGDARQQFIKEHKDAQVAVGT
jgi:hypothetical protein